MSVRRGYVWALGFCVALLGASLLYRWLSPREDPLEEVARKCLGYLEGRNVRGLLWYLTDEEKELLDLDKEKMSLFLNEFLWRRLEGFAPQGEVKIERSGTRTAVWASRVYVHPDGRRCSFFMVVVPTEKGPRLKEFVLSTTVSILETYLTKEQRNADDLELLAYASRQAMPDLNRLPIRGIVRFETEGTFQPRMLTWSEWANEWTERWRKKRRQEVEAIYQKG